MFQEETNIYGASMEHLKDTRYRSFNEALVQIEKIVIWFVFTEIVHTNFLFVLVKRPLVKLNRYPLITILGTGLPAGTHLTR